MEPQRSCPYPGFAFLEEDMRQALTEMDLSAFRVATAGGAAKRKGTKALISALYLPSVTIAKMMQCSKPSNFNLWRRIFHPWRTGSLR
jgi:hypothetical protein